MTAFPCQNTEQEVALFDSLHSNGFNQSLKTDGKKQRAVTDKRKALVFRQVS